MSGQGPYFGQKGWFQLMHPEKVQSALDRYDKEIERVTGVIDYHLNKQATDYLVGNDVTYADLMFIPWFRVSESLLNPDTDRSQWPRYQAWLSRLVARPAVARVLARQDEAAKKMLEKRAAETAAREQQENTAK
jgi:glutathione S-transferase